MTLDIPILIDTEILVVGSSSGAIAAALAAAGQGRRVHCVTSFTYPGEDICAHARYWPAPGQAPATELATRVFGEAFNGGTIPTPMHVKYTLEQALIAAKIDFLYMTHPVCLLRDAEGTLAGLVVANRSGFQAIRASTIIDATERALVGRMTAAKFQAYTPGKQRFRRVVIGGDGSNAARVEATPMPSPVQVGDRAYTAFAFDLVQDLTDTSPGAFAKAEVAAHLQTWHPEQAYASDRLFTIHRDRLEAEARAATLEAIAADGYAALRCGKDPVFVLSSCAALEDAAAVDLMEPCNLMAVGEALGSCVAGVTPTAIAAATVTPDYSANAIEGVDVQRNDRYFRMANADTIRFDLNRLPELGAVDVVVAGGGTAGAPAGIAAGRKQAHSVILEVLPNLGGVGTEGRISVYYYGNCCGFTAEIDRGVHALGPNPEFETLSNRWNPEWKKQWYLKAAHEAGTEIWFGALSVATAMKDNHVAGVVAATPYGLGILKAEAVVDATGNADIAAAAGAEVVNISKAHVAVQGTGVGPVTPGSHCENNDHTFVDDTDVMDVTRAFAYAREKFKHAFDLVQIIDSRQRQQIRGEISLDPLDFLANRTFPDTVVTAQSNFDSHGFTIHPVFMAKAPDEESLRAYVPLRCLLPAGVEGVLVTGLGVSSHRDSLPIIRMQADVQNQGYAAGYAAAMAALEGCGLRELDIDRLQEHLVEVGILEPDVPTHTDSFPLPEAAVADAVATGTDSYLGLAVIFGHPDTSLPLLRAAYAAESETVQKCRYAHLLGLMGDGTGLATLMASVDNSDWDKGWNYKGMGQFGFSLSPVDSMLVALAYSGAPEVTAVLLRKAATLSDAAEFSHYRALTLAFEAMPTLEAAPHFERLLHAAQGQTRPDISTMVADVPQQKNDTSQRNRELTELLLARGLYACGDPNGHAANILAAYSKDLHGHYARHAQAILGTGPR